MIKRIHFLTYPKASVLKYRKALIHDLESDYEVRLINPFEYFWKNIELIISSNTISNIFSLLFVFSKRLIILNGLGRNYKNKAWRLLFVILLKAQDSRRCIVISQNYRDHRYFRRIGITTEFIMGSGGRRLKTGEKNKIIVVSREKKLKSQKKAINAFLGKHPKINLDIYGMLSASHDFGCRVRFNGYVKNENLFRDADYLYHPSGYGDGFPHSIADAICSGIDVILAKRNYIEYGLYLMANREHFSDGYVRLSFSGGKNCALSKQVQLKYVNRQYMCLINRLLR